MDMKNVAILLMFLLCVLGLIIGAYYTGTSESSQNLNDYDEVVNADSNGTITINLELKEKNESDFVDFLYDKFVNRNFKFY